MNRFITLALVLIASLAVGHCSSISYGNPSYGPAVQQVSLSSLGNLGIESYLNGVQAPAASGYSSYAPATSIVAAPAPAYSSAPAYSAPSASYSAPKYTSQPAYAAQLYPGQQNYNAYQSPPQYSTLAVPVAASDAVAKLYVPQQQNGYGSSNYGNY